MIMPADDHHGGDDMRKDDMERTAAHLAEAVAHGEPESMPADVARRLKAKLADVSAQHVPVSASARDRSDTAPTPTPQPDAVARRSVIGRIGFAFAGVAAAACLVVLIVRSLPGGDSGGAGSVTDSREQFRQVATDLRTMRWRPNREDPAVLEDAHVTGGDVIWSESSHDGYARVCQLEINDPQVARYHLWIVRDGDSDADAIHVQSFDITQTNDYETFQLDDAAAAKITNPVRTFVTVEVAAPGLTPASPNLARIALEAQWYPAG